LDIAGKIPKHTLIIRDETIETFGLGSRRIQADVVALSETARKYGLNLAFLSPSEKEIEVAKWDLFTVDIDYENRITRFGLRETFTKQFLGAVYVEVLPDDDEDWVNYNIRKDQVIDDIRSKQRGGSKENYIKMAIEMFESIDLTIYDKKKQRLAYIRSKYPNLVNAEIEMIHTFLEIAIDKGKYVLLEDDSEEKSEKRKEQDKFINVVMNENK
jgi:hypothetical protein